MTTSILLHMRLVFDNLDIIQQECKIVKYKNYKFIRILLFQGICWGIRKHSEIGTVEEDGKQPIAGHRS